MEYILDNPPWYALITGNKQLSRGQGEVRFFESGVSPFAGLETFSTEGFKQLYEQVPHNGPVLLMSTDEHPLIIPAIWNAGQAIKGLQMVKDKPVGYPEITARLTPLKPEHIEQMLSLTALTKPGPFGRRTIEFGHYEGVFEGDKLVAMCGQRLHPLPFAEISAVCTHPDHTGKGYARQLLTSQLKRIEQAGDTAFLHVRYDNKRAIDVYRSLGFSARKVVYFYLLNKNV